MISGTILLEDLVLTFSQVYSPGFTSGPNIEFTISNIFDGTAEKKIVPQDKFFKALSIAVHNDGTPNFEKDYPDAESIMGDIRWIP